MKNIVGAMQVAHGRMSLPPDKLSAHFGGDLNEMLDEIEPFVRHMADKTQESLERQDATEEEISVAVTKIIVSSVFLLGRAYEEMELVDAAMDGELNHLCTKCGGK